MWIKLLKVLRGVLMVFSWVGSVVGVAQQIVPFSLLEVFDNPKNVWAIVLVSLLLSAWWIIELLIENQKLKGKSPIIDIRYVHVSGHHWTNFVLSVDGTKEISETMVIGGDAPDPYKGLGDQDFNKVIVVGGTASIDLYKPSLRDTHGSTGDITPIEEDVYLGTLDVVNNPDEKEGVFEALAVTGKIKFFDLSLESIYDDVVEGRWADKPEPSRFMHDYKDKFEYLEVNIPANGNPRKLCLVMKREEDEFCMVYSLKNYEKKVAPSEYFLRHKPFYASVKISGSNFKSKEFWYKIKKIEKDGKFKIKKLKGKPKPNRKGITDERAKKEEK